MLATSVSKVELAALQYDLGTTSFDRKIEINTAARKYPKHLTLLHEMAHCLDHNGKITANLRAAIDEAYVPQELYIQCNYDLTKDPDNITLREFLNLVTLLPKTEYALIKRGESIRDTYKKEGKLYKEIFPRLAVLYFLTNGSWIIPCKSMENISLRAVMPGLIDAFEDERLRLCTNVRKDLLLDDAAAAASASANTVEISQPEDSASPVLPEDIRDKFNALQLLGSKDEYNMNYDFILCESLCESADQSQYIVSLNSYGYSQTFKILKTFNFQGKDIYIFRRGYYFQVCGLDPNGKFFHEFIDVAANKVGIKTTFSLKFPELNSQIISEIYPFIPKYYESEKIDHMHIKVNGTQVFEAVSPRGLTRFKFNNYTYLLREYFYLNEDGTRTTLYNCRAIPLQAKTKINGNKEDMIYVIETKDGEFYEWDFENETFGQKCDPSDFKKEDVKPIVPAIAAEKVSKKTTELLPQSLLVG